MFRHTGYLYKRNDNVGRTLFSTYADDVVAGGGSSGVLELGAVRRPGSGAQREAGTHVVPHCCSPQGVTRRKDESFKCVACRGCKMQCGAAENEDGDIRLASYDNRVVRERTKKMQQQQRK